MWVQAEDVTCKKVKEHCLAGWPEKHSVSKELMPYERAELTVPDDILLKGDRLIISVTLQKEILTKIQDGHQGMTKCHARAQHSVWWPGISSHICQMAEHCHTCNHHKIVHCEPLLPTSLLARPWQRVGMDLFDGRKKTYLLIVDYFSRGCTSERHIF